MKRRAVIMHLALFLPFTSTAAAQDGGTGTMMRDHATIGVPEGKSVGDKARTVVDQFAFCIVRHHYAQVVRTLATDMARQYETLPQLMDRECFFGRNGVRQSGGTTEVELNLSPTSFRGALYKALVQQKLGRKPVEFGTASAEMPSENGQFLQLAGCVARRDPTTSLQLLTAKAGSKQEDAAFGQLQPHLGQCLGGGTSSGFPKSAFVAFLAEAYYREAMAGQGAAE